MGKFSGGALFCDRAISIVPIFNSKSELSRTNLISFWLVKPWTMPFSSCMKPLLLGYQAGLEAGDTESACWDILAYMYCRSLSGHNLDSILADFRTYWPQVKDLGRDEQSTYTFYQVFFCFMKSSADPTKIEGDIIPNADKFEKELNSLESKISLLGYKIQQSWLCSVFGEHERGAKLALERGDLFFKYSGGLPYAMPDTFHRGISLFDMARRTKKSKYKRAAKKTLSTMQKWVQSNNPNVVHKAAILEAELHALNGNKEKACRTYEKSITSSVRCGAVPDAAQASERYGEYLLNECEDADKNAMHYLEKALNFYKDWGAMAKCEQMNAKYPSLPLVPQNIEIRE